MQLGDVEPLFTCQLFLPNPDVVVIVLSMKCAVSEPVRILSTYLSLDLARPPTLVQA